MFSLISHRWNKSSILIIQKEKLYNSVVEEIGKFLLWMDRGTNKYYVIILDIFAH